MDEIQWDIQEIKHLKKIQLVQSNFFMLLYVVLFAYLAENGESSILIGLSCALIWVIVVISLYTLITGRHFGTKTHRRVQEFDRKRTGEKSWKRHQLIGNVAMIAFAVFITVLIFVMGINSARVEFPLNAYPIIGVWVGSNIGEIVRMNKLRE
ncbi:hypothetical protein VBD025_16075 [Virgibacillus flavescens]|uniref:hypothetical protein n=1 Tax=Virgibacillus flavescens TaxID=1611422 RepID=UPI003D326DBE